MGKQMILFVSLSLVVSCAFILLGMFVEGSDLSFVWSSTSQLEKISNSQQSDKSEAIWAMSVRKFNAKGDGSDDTTAFQTAINTACASDPSVPLIVPPGKNWLVTRLHIPSTCDGLVIEGTGTRFSTTIIVQEPFQTTITNDGYKTTIRHLSFAAYGKATGGWVVAGSGSYDLDDVGVYDFANGFYQAGQSQTTYRHIYIRNLQPKTGLGIEITGVGEEHLIDDYIYEGSRQSMPRSALLLSGGAAINLSNLELTSGGHDLEIAPQNGAVVSAVQIATSYFDTADYGLLINPDPKSTVQRLTITASWFGGQSEAGIKVLRNTQGLQCSGCQFFQSKIGLSWGDNQTNGLIVTGSIFSGNSLYGVYLSSKSSVSIISGNLFGPYGGFSNNGSCLNINGEEHSQLEDVLLASNFCAVKPDLGILSSVPSKINGSEPTLSK